VRFDQDTDFSLAGLKGNQPPWCEGPYGGAGSQETEDSLQSTACSDPTLPGTRKWAQNHHLLQASHTLPAAWDAHWAGNQGS
jgi:hypothetical protein